MEINGFNCGDGGRFGPKPGRPQMNGDETGGQGQPGLFGRKITLRSYQDGDIVPGTGTKHVGDGTPRRRLFFKTIGNEFQGSGAFPDKISYRNRLFHGRDGRLQGLLGRRKGNPAGPVGLIDRSTPTSTAFSTNHS